MKTETTPQISQTRLKIRKELEAPPALRAFGSGWISGVLGLILGTASLLSVIMLRFPNLLTVKETQPLIQHPAFRTGIFGLLILAFSFSLLNLILRSNKCLGITGISTTLLAVILGGTTATAITQTNSPIYFGLDFFVLNVLFTGLLFIPIETIFPKREEQALFRQEWREDLFYYLISSLLVQIITKISFFPVQTLFKLTNWTEFRTWVANLPFLIQLITIMFLTDVVQYWVHRVFHKIPMLWKFHSVHHSALHMDWMAGARMHFFEILALRGTTVFPMIMLGFTQTAVNTYILIVYLYSTFVHANLGWNLNFIEKFLVTPRFHHWHHGIEKEAIDVNFSIHFPLLDKIFGTHHMPKDGNWPEGYGIKGNPVPQGYWKQFLHPFSKKP
jgi:sterol desaturase/sphingolipid hydroxylase (fatty acid hydroxylase superfamily)